MARGEVRLEHAFAEAGVAWAEAIRDVLEQRRGAIEACYDAALARNPTLAGDVRYVMTIRPSGIVGPVDVERTDPALDAAGVTRCVKRKLRTTRFARATREEDFVLEDRVALVTLPFSFVSPAGAGPGRPSPESNPDGAVVGGGPVGPTNLRLTAEFFEAQINLVANWETAAQGVLRQAAPPDRVEIPHLLLSAAEVAARRAACRPPADPAEFDDCAYWDYLRELLETCYGSPAGQARVPDLKLLNLALRELADRAVSVDGSPLAGRWQLTIRAVGNIPYCRLVAVLDFARFRDIDLDWTADAAFAAGMQQSAAAGNPDPLLAPASWNAAMRAALLFPVVTLLY
jgi:hypothetical protein